MHGLPVPHRHHDVYHALGHDSQEHGCCSLNVMLYNTVPQGRHPPAQHNLPHGQPFAGTEFDLAVSVVANDSLMLRDLPRIVGAWMARLGSHPAPRRRRVGAPEDICLRDWCSAMSALVTVTIREALVHSISEARARVEEAEAAWRAGTVLSFAVYASAEIGGTPYEIVGTQTVALLDEEQYAFMEEGGEPRYAYGAASNPLTCAMAISALFGRSDLWGAAGRRDVRRFVEWLCGGRARAGARAVTFGDLWDATHGFRACDVVERHPTWGTRRLPDLLQRLYHRPAERHV